MVFALTAIAGLRTTFFQYWRWEDVELIKVPMLQGEVKDATEEVLHNSDTQVWRLPVWLVVSAVTAASAAAVGAAARLLSCLLPCWILLLCFSAAQPSLWQCCGGVAVVRPRVTSSLAGTLCAWCRYQCCGAATSVVDVCDLPYACCRWQPALLRQLL